MCLFTSCNNRSIGFEVVSVRPIFGWVDGCNTLTVSGHGFPTTSDETSATIGEASLADVAVPESPLDLGYAFTATVPAAESGYADVTVTNGEESSTLSDAYFYVECSHPALAETATPDRAITADTTITVTGCNLDAERFKIQLDTQQMFMTSTCGTGTATFVAPDLPSGLYAVSIVDRETGEVVFPAPCDTATSCDAAPILRYGLLP
jgi:hypothetical protein